MKLTFDIKNQIITRTDISRVIANSADYLEAEFSFSSDWDNLTKVAHFKNGNVVLDVPLDNNEIKADKHLNLGVGTWKVSVEGVLSEQRIETNATNVTVRASGSVAHMGPIPDVYQQLLAIISELNAEAAPEALVNGAVEDFIDANYSQMIANAMEVSKEIFEQIIEAASEKYKQMLENMRIAIEHVRDTLPLDYDTLTSALNDNFGGRFFYKSLTENNEIGKFYCEPHKTYVIYTNLVKNCQARYYEFYKDGTYETIKFDRENNVNIYTTHDDVDYIRIFAFDVQGIGEIASFICEFSGASSFYDSVLQSSSISISNDNLMGYTGVLELPTNKVYKITRPITEDKFAGLPKYNDFATLTIISSDKYDARARYDVCIYASLNSGLYLGTIFNTDLKWYRVDGYNLINVVFEGGRDLYTDAEICKFYPTENADYMFYIKGTGYVFDVYEFHEDGSYKTLAAGIEAPYAMSYKTPSNVSYIRFYNKSGEKNVSTSVVVTDAVNDIVSIANKENKKSDIYDIAFSNEFASVRKFTVIGDSMASGYYKPTGGAQRDRNIDYSWCQVLARMNGQTCQNASKSGITCETWWTDNDCKPNVTTSKKSQVYVVGLGTNDYKDVTPTDAQKGSVADIDFNNYNNNANSFYGNYAKILQYVHEVNPLAQIICLTIPLPRAETPWKEDAIREICALPEFANYVSLCDLVKDFRDVVDSDLLAEHRLNGHFSPAGYANSAKALHFALSKTMRANKLKFETIPQIPYDA